MKNFLLLVISLVFTSLSVLPQSTDFYYSSPVEGAKFVNPYQVILLKTDQKILSVDESLIILENESGNHFINIEIRDGNMLFISPNNSFGRESNYKLTLKSGALNYDVGSSHPFVLNFSTERIDNLSLTQKFYQKQEEKQERHSKSGDKNVSAYVRPENDNNYPPTFPAPYVENVNDPYPGYLFTNIGARNAAGYESYSVILDNNAIPIWFSKRNGRDMKILHDQTFTHDYRNNANLDSQGYLIYNSQLQVTDTIRMGNGYFVDTHDMLLLDNNHYLLMAYDPQIVDMSQIVEGGDTNAIVTGFVVQEVDKQRNVYFEWRSWDHLEITDVSDSVDLTAEEIDYVHGNAFEFDLEGNLMMSMRNMEEITKINYETGEVIWRLGLLAKKNEFTFNDTIGWSWQHDIRQLPNGNITIYDNGTHHPIQFSQALEYQIDEDNKTATLVWNHREDPDIYRRATGSHRRITEDRSLIGWGMGSPLIGSEVNISGKKHLDLLAPEGTNNYRLTRYDWIHNVFTFSKDTLDYGEYDDYVPVSRAFKVKNEMANDTISITSAHNHLSDYWLVSALPVSIAPGEEADIIVNFQPQGLGIYNDVLTLNYDNTDTTERIARQIILIGRTKDSQAPEVLISPLHGSTDVLPLTAPSLIFNESVKLVNGDELTDENVKEAISFRKFDTEGDEVAYTASVKEDNQIVEITPDAPLEVDQAYYLAVLPDKLMDDNDNVMTEVEFSYFTTGEAFGIKELENDKVFVYPNPVTDALNINIDLPGEKTIYIYNFQGQKIMEFATTNSMVQMPTSNLPKGVYSGYIKTDKKAASFRFVK